MVWFVFAFSSYQYDWISAGVSGEVVFKIHGAQVDATTSGVDCDHVPAHSTATRLSNVAGFWKR